MLKAINLKKLPLNLIQKNRLTIYGAEFPNVRYAFMQKTQTTNPLEENINKNIENQGKKILKKL
jgi:hypothetical protein